VKEIGKRRGRVRVGGDGGKFLNEERSTPGMPIKPDFI